jgi:hypothetical protein
MMRSRIVSVQIIIEVCKAIQSCLSGEGNSGRFPIYCAKNEQIKGLGFADLPNDRPLIIDAITRLWHLLCSPGC